MCTQNGWKETIFDCSYDTLNLIKWRTNNVEQFESIVCVRWFIHFNQLNGKKSLYDLVFLNNSFFRMAKQFGSPRSKTKEKKTSDLM